MSGADFKRAKELALKLLQKNFLTEPPVVAQELAEQAGLVVTFRDFASVKPEYATISGFIDLQTNKLYVNSAENVVRQNFTIAHELGHYLLGHIRNNPEYVQYIFRRPLEEQEDPIIEQEANCFAANLLVPEKFLKDMIKKYPFATNYQLANLFGVSELVIRYRRNFLGV